jgi:hypothetical protein
MHHHKEGRVKRLYFWEAQIQYNSTIQFACGNPCSDITVPTIICPILFQITPPQPSNITRCGTLYFPTNQPSKPSRGVRLINKKTDLSYTYPTLSYWIQPRIQHPTRGLQYTVSPACPPTYVISSKITGHADIYNSSIHEPTPKQKH